MRVLDIIANNDLTTPCVICGVHMSCQDFNQQEAMAITGPITDVVCHVTHFEKPGTKEYMANIKKLALHYLQINKVPLRPELIN